MPLQQLVAYFNDRFQAEFHSIYRPFIFKDAKVSGLFGPLKIDTKLLPIRQTHKPTAIEGHLAQLEVSNYGVQPIFDWDRETQLTCKELDLI